MKQLRQMSILVRGAQLLLLVLALFLVVWLVPDAGKKHASGTEASEAETDGGDVAENEKIEPPGIWRRRCRCPPAWPTRTRRTSGGSSRSGRGS